MASGTKLMKEISDQFLVCKICMNTYQKPKTLSCQHTFCNDCLQRHVDTEINERASRHTVLYSRAITCPLCQKRVELPTGGVRRLPDNFLVSNLTDVLAKRCASKMAICDICRTLQRRPNEACSKCLDCDKFLCLDCVKQHSLTKVTAGHGLVDIEGQKDIDCKWHNGETVRFYCEKCEACICVLCTFQEHKSHDICSFRDSFSKHKVFLESLLGRSRERINNLMSRLKFIDRCETLNKALKDRIRELAISYTSQVRAKEKELMQKVDDVISREVRQLCESKSWMRQTLDSLQSACQLTEVVMQDKGVEMLLFKKEIQGKLEDLLTPLLPQEPDERQQLDAKLVPGEIHLGEIIFTISDDNNGIIQKPRQQIPQTADNHSQLITLRNEMSEKHETLSKFDEHCVNSSQDANIDNHVQQQNISRKENCEALFKGTIDSNKTVSIQTDAVYIYSDDNSARSAGKNREESTILENRSPINGSKMADNAVQTVRVAFSSRSTSTDLSCSQIKKNDNRCLNAINTKEDSTIAKSNNHSHLQQNVSSTACVLNTNEIRCTSKPDLLADAGFNSAPKQILSHWIRSRKVQTDISALEKGYDLFAGSTDQRSQRSTHDPICSLNDDVTFNKTGNAILPSVVDLVPKRDITSVHQQNDKHFYEMETKMCEVGIMCSVDRRTIFSQTQGPRTNSIGAKTEHASNDDKGCNTAVITSKDSETMTTFFTCDNQYVPNHERTVTKRESNASEVRHDAGTMTSLVKTVNMCVQVSPFGVTSGTNTLQMSQTHRHCQTTGNLYHRDVNPDNTQPSITQFAIPDDLNAKSFLKKSFAWFSSRGPQNNIGKNLYVESSARGTDKATETMAPRLTSRAVGPNSASKRSKDVIRSMQDTITAVEQEPNTDLIEKCDVWTNTLQPQMINTGITPTRPLNTDVGTFTAHITVMSSSTYTEVKTYRDSGTVTAPITVMSSSTYTEVKTYRDSGTETAQVVCDSETYTGMVLLVDAQTDAFAATTDRGTDAVALTNLIVVEKSGNKNSFNDTRRRHQLCDMDDKCVNTVVWDAKTITTQTAHPFVHLNVAVEKKEDNSGVVNSIDDNLKCHDYATVATNCDLFHTSDILCVAVQTNPSNVSEDDMANSSSVSYVHSTCLNPDVNDRFMRRDNIHMVDKETLTDRQTSSDGNDYNHTLLVHSNYLTRNGRNIEYDCHGVRKTTHPVDVSINTHNTATLDEKTFTSLRIFLSKGMITTDDIERGNTTFSSINKSDMNTHRTKHGLSRSFSLNKFNYYYDERKLTKLSVITQDKSVETDDTFLNDRLTDCISKLRSVSERLNSPMTRRNSTKPMLIETSHCNIESHKHKEHIQKSNLQMPSDVRHEKNRDEDEGSVIRTTHSGETSNMAIIRKSQPLTSLKPRLSIGNHVSLHNRPTHNVIECHPKIKMGSLVSYARLPLSRHNSVPKVTTDKIKLPLPQSSNPLPPPSSMSRDQTSNLKCPISSTVVHQEVISPQSELFPTDFSWLFSKYLQHSPSLPAMHDTDLPNASHTSLECSTAHLENHGHDLRQTSMSSSFHGLSEFNTSSVSDPISALVEQYPRSEERIDSLVDKKQDTSSLSSSADFDLQHSSSIDENLTKKKHKKGFIKRLLPGKKKIKECKEKNDDKNAKLEHNVALPTQLSLSFPPPQKTQLPSLNQTHQRTQKLDDMNSTCPNNSTPNNEVITASSQSAKANSMESVPRSSIPTSIGSTDHTIPISSHSINFANAKNVQATPALSLVTNGPPHQYPPLPAVVQSPTGWRKPRQFIYVRQRLVSIQQDNVEEVTEKKEKSKNKHPK